MNRWLKSGTIVLAMMLVLSGCSGKTPEKQENVGAALSGTDRTLSEEEQAAIDAEIAAGGELDSKSETEGSKTTPSTAEIKETETVSDAVVDGTLMKHYDEAYMVDNCSAGGEWVILCSMDGKGYGTPYNAVNLKTGDVIYGEEGAEVYFCPDGILQLEWRSQDTGKPVSAETVLLEIPADGSEGRTFDLYLVKYDLSGTKISEEYIASYTQSEEGDTSGVFEALNQALSRYGAESPRYNYEYYSFTADGNDAVAYDANGNEVIRYPGKGAEAENMFATVQGKVMCVSVMNWPSYTDIYQLN